MKEHRQVAHPQTADLPTATAFSYSWNTVGEGSVYTVDQVLEWLSPLRPEDFAGKEVLDLGFGNGSFLVHVGTFGPRRLVGVELGHTLESARKNLRHLPVGIVELVHGDLTQVRLGQFDCVYCIGVLHHLKIPEAGFRAVLRHVKSGGRFHCWVYAREGNGLVIAVVDPIRRIASRLPWWLTKYLIALPLVLPYYFYAKAIRIINRTAAGRGLRRFLPLYDYSCWISSREFHFFHHVAFDQLVTPRTRYLRRSTVEEWLRDPAIDPASIYTIWRNSNSWKFGGRKRGETEG